MGTGQVDRGAVVTHARKPRGHRVDVLGPGGDLQLDRQRRLPAQRGERVVGDHEALRQDHDPVGARLHLGQRVAGKQDRGALGGKLVEHGVEVAPRDRVEARGRLVEDQKLRLADQRLGKPDALAHALRIGADAALRGLGQAHPFQQAHRRARGLAPQAQIGADLLEPGERGVEGHVFRQVGDLAARGAAAGGVADDVDLARIEGDQAEDDLHQRRLAGAVVAQKRHALARRDSETDVRQRPRRAEALSEM
jgi:hypothetical protein